MLKKMMMMVLFRRLATTSAGVPMTLLPKNGVEDAQTFEVTSVDLTE